MTSQWWSSRCRPDRSLDPRAQTISSIAGEATGFIRGAGGYFDGGADEGNGGRERLVAPGCRALLGLRSETGTKARPGAERYGRRGRRERRRRRAERDGAEELAEVVDLGVRRGLGDGEAAGTVGDRGRAGLGSCPGSPPEGPNRRSSPELDGERRERPIRERPDPTPTGICTTIGSGRPCWRPRPGAG